MEKVLLIGIIFTFLFSCLYYVLVLFIDERLKKIEKILKDCQDEEIKEKEEISRNKMGF